MYDQSVDAAGEKKVREAGRVYDASFEVSSWLVITFRARGGARGSGQERNTEYKPGLLALVRKLAMKGAVVREVRLASQRALGRPPEERILRLEGFDYPVELHPELDFEALVAKIAKASKDLFRKPHSKPTGGNPTRTIEIVLDSGPWATAEDLGRYLSEP